MENKLRHYFDCEDILEYNDSRFVMYAFILLYAVDGVLDIKRTELMSYTGVGRDKLVSCLSDLRDMGRITFAKKGRFDFHIEVIDE